MDATIKRNAMQIVKELKHAQEFPARYDNCFCKHGIHQSKADECGACELGLSFYQYALNCAYEDAREAKLRLARRIMDYMTNDRLCQDLLHRMTAAGRMSVLGHAVELGH